MEPSKKHTQKSHHYPRYDFGPRSRGYWKRRASRVARRFHKQEADKEMDRLRNPAISGLR